MGVANHLIESYSWAFEMEKKRSSFHKSITSRKKNKRCGSHIKAVNHSWKMLKCGCGLHWGAHAFVFIESFAMAIMQDNDKVERRKEGMRREGKRMR